MIKNSTLAKKDMIGYSPEGLASYLEQHAMERHPVFRDMERYAMEISFPIVGPLVGQLLFILSRASRARSVFEIGSGFGYSALWFALALPQDGKVICTEYDKENISRGSEYFKQARILSKVKFMEGNGIEILERNREKYDIIFNDANKEYYPLVIDLALKKLKKNGLLISDNVLWKGQVTDKFPDEKTQCVIDYNRKIFSMPEFYSSIIPIRDGVSVSIKIK